MIKFKEKIKNDVYIIAEMSANHAGKIENALKIVEEAAKAGADCVKIQTYMPDSLTIDCKDPAYMIKDGLWKGYNYYQLYQEAMTPWEWQDKIRDKCVECGVDFLSTPFDKISVDFLEGLGVEFYKIASFEMIDIPLVEYVASKGKPIIMSCGMGSVEEIEEALAACQKYGNEDVTLLKCCSQYPAKYEDLNLSVIPDMAHRFGKTIGLSDHSFGSVAPVMAVAYGAHVIEKHLCLSRKMESQDAGFSMEVDEFAHMVDDIRKATLAIGQANYELTENEKKGTIGRRSLVAVADINVGDKFTDKNVRSIRPAIGIKPKYYAELIGRNAKRKYRFGEPILIDEVK